MTIYYQLETITINEMANSYTIGRSRSRNFIFRMRNLFSTKLYSGSYTILEHIRI